MKIVFVGDALSVWPGLAHDLELAGLSIETVDDLTAMAHSHVAQSVNVVVLGISSNLRSIESLRAGHPTARIMLLLPCAATGEIVAAQLAAGADDVLSQDTTYSEVLRRIVALSRLRSHGTEARE